MAVTINPAAPHHLPPFITAPGETDYLYNGSLIFIIVLIIMLGVLYFRLHALPEHLAHGNADKQQFQIVGVLALLALFTHNSIFWVAALLLALIRLPDLATPLGQMANSLAKMVKRRQGTVDETPDGAVKAPVRSEERQHDEVPSAPTFERELAEQKKLAGSKMAATVGDASAPGDGEARSKSETGKPDKDDLLKRART